MPRAECGFTIPEFLTASFVGLLLLSLAMTSIVSSRHLMQQDFGRIQLSQNIRGGVDLVGIDIRIAGENLAESFPALELINGVDNPDQLVLRRSMLSEVLTLCSEITAGSSTSQLIFATGDGTVATGVIDPGCVYSDPGQTQNYDAWRNYRTANGGSVGAYIYDSVADVGEFFIYSGEIQSTDWYAIERSGGTWQHDYPFSSSSVYLLQEHRYRVVDGMLELVIDQDWSTPLRVINDLEDFQVRLRFMDGSTDDEFLSSDSRRWTEIRTVQIGMSGSEEYKGRVTETQLQAEYFPRNVLSN